MYITLIRFFTLLFLVFSLGYASSDRTTKNNPSNSVKQLVEKYELDLVGYDYVNSIVDNKNPNSLVIDARPEKKYLVSHIPTAISIPIVGFKNYIYKLDKVSKDTEIITYCGGYSCSKSPKLAGKLKSLGFKNVKAYLAGMPEWSKRNFVVVETAAVLSIYKKNSALFIDARPYDKYIKGTIPGAISIPDTQATSLSGRFPRDINTPIITFCGGYKCNKSYNLAKFLIAEGYKNVKVYAAGMPNWKKAGFETTKRKVIAPQEKADKKIEIVHGVAKGVDEGSVDGEWFKSKLNKLSSNLQIVDVRPKADFNTGHLKGAINIYAEEMSPKEFYKALPKNKTIVISCVSGGRALEAWMKLNDANLDVSKIFYFDAYIDCTNNQCKIEVNEPLD